MMPRRVCGVVTRSRERGRQREQRCGQHESTETHVVCPFKNKKTPPIGGVLLGNDFRLLPVFNVSFGRDTFGDCRDGQSLRKQGVEYVPLPVQHIIMSII
jgi:hypothetical protein